VRDGTPLSEDHRLLLIVEDDREVAETLHDFLADEGFRIVMARNGKDALEQLRAGLRPSAIVLDLLMPEMDGWQFRKEQVADARLRDIATIIFTATALKPESSASLPGVEVMRKPIDADELVRTVRRASGFTGAA
jgi:two-component system response regulator MprA